jgi:hypothetical protein
MWRFRAIKWFPDDLLNPLDGIYSDKESNEIVQDNCHRILCAPGGLVVQNITLAICVIFNRGETISILMWMWNGMRSFMEPIFGVFLAKIIAGLLTYIIALPLSIIGALMVVAGAIILIVLGL